ncbi:MAG: hypothetical protein ABEH78_06160 [Haloferacaceae archaeon]
MPTTRTYRCLRCLEHTISRDFDVSHVSKTCPQCGSFERLVNERVYDQLQAFESEPPATVDWDDLDRPAKLRISERVARTGQSIEEFDHAG